MSARMLLRGFALYLALGLVTGSLQAQETKLVATAAPGSASSSPEPASLDEARALIQALEKQVVELKAALAAKAGGGTAAEPAAAPAPAPEPGYRFDPASESMRFLNLGVKKNYIAAERNRLIDQLHTNIPPLYEPAFSPFHGYTLPARAFRVEIGDDRFINHHDFGRDKQYALFFDNVKIENQHVNTDILYGLDENTTLRVNIPLRSTIISGTGKAFRIQPMVISMNGQGFGLGDIQFMVKHKWFDQAEKPFNFATVVGVQFPTGKNDSKFNDAQTLIMNGKAMPVSSSSGGPRVDLFSDDLRIPNSAQPGTGAWGVLFGVMGTRQLTWNRTRGALHAGALYKAMKDTGEGVRPGNELVFGASFVRPPTESEHFTFDLTFFGRNKQSERYPGLITHPEADSNGMPIMNPDGSLKMFTTPRPPFEHGTAMFFSPSLVIIPKSTLRLTISPMFRIREPNQGPTPAFRLVFGATSTF